MTSFFSIVADDVLNFESYDRGRATRMIRRTGGREIPINRIDCGAIPGQGVLRLHGFEASHTAQSLDCSAFARASRRLNRCHDHRNRSANTTTAQNWMAKPSAKALCRI